MALFKTINTFMDAFKKNYARIKAYAYRVWLTCKEIYGAFFNRLYADPRSGVIYAKCEKGDFALMGMRIEKEFNVVKTAWEYVLVEG